MSRRWVWSLGAAMVSEYTALHDGAKERSVKPSPSPNSGPAPHPRDGGDAVETRHREDGGALPLFPAAARFLPGPLADNFRILADYAGALRAIADHPALDKARKEARLKAVADAIEGTKAPQDGDDAVRAALTLRHLLESRGLDPQPAWRMLQAAGQDISKTAYPDWSDLLTWCRFWAAPMGRMTFLLADGEADAVESSESLAIAVELLFLIEQAPAHYRWLGRVYLPERWFKEADAEQTQLGQAQPAPALDQVFARALDEAGRLLDASDGLHRRIPNRRLRIAAATAHGEARAWAACLARPGPLAGVSRPGSGARFGAACAGIWRGLSS